MNENSKQKSHIRGVGYGSDHIWIHQETKQLSPFYNPNYKNNVKDKQSTYKCQDCGVVFCHYYDMIPDIFTAIKNSKISNKCGFTIKSNSNDDLLLEQVNDKFNEIEQFILKALPDPVVRKHFLRNLLVDLDQSVDHS